MTELIELWDGLTMESFISFVTNEIKTNDFFAAAGLAGILSAFWLYFKGVPKWAWERISRKLTYRANIYETNEFFPYFEQWLRDNHEKSYRNVEVVLDFEESDDEDEFSGLPPSYKERNNVVAESSNNKEEKDVEKVNYKQFTDTFFIRRGLVWLKVFKGREKLENTSDLRNAYLNRFELSGIFAKRTINKLLEEVLEYNLKLKKDKEKVSIEINTNSSDYWMLNEEIEPKKIDNIILDNKEELLEDIDEFLSGKKWYKTRNIPYKRGYMFHGKPGNGKTSLAMAIAQYTRRDLYMLTIGKDTSDKELMRLFRNLNSNSVLVIEDIDAMFDTERKSKKTSFSFSTLLNCLDGVLSKENIIVIFTTNHPEKLDSALIREGRIDFKMEVSNPNKEGIEEYIDIFYETEDSKIQDFEVNNNLSMVKVQGICLKQKENREAAINQINKILQDE